MFVDNSDLDKKITTLAAKPEAKSKQDKMANFQAFDLSFFPDKSRFEDVGAQKLFSISASL